MSVVAGDKPCSRVARTIRNLTAEADSGTLSGPTLGSASSGEPVRRHIRAPHRLPGNFGSNARGNRATQVEFSREMVHPGRGSPMLDVIWLGAYTRWERPWVNEVLLSELPHRNFVYPALPSSNLARVLIVFSENGSTPNRTVLELLDSFAQADLLLLSDESLAQRAKHYPRARRFLRAYYSPLDFPHKDAFCVPIGFLDGFAKGKEAGIWAESGVREKSWAFFGQVKNRSRRRMVRAFSGLDGGRKDHVLLPTNSFADSQGASRSEIAAHFDVTNFVPCPPGNIHPETFRVMEALERGAIPVVVRFYGLDIMRLVFGKHPFLVGSSWSNAVAQCAFLLEHPDLLEERLLSVQTWYRKFVKQMAGSTAAFLLSEDDELQSTGRGLFRFETRRVFDFWVYAVFRYHFTLRPKLERIIRWLARVWRAKFSRQTL